MAKAVFRPSELVVLSEKVFIEAPPAYPGLVHLSPVEEEVAVHEEVEEYTGPTAEDLRREADEFRMRWETEREAMIQEARDKAASIVQDAQASAARDRQRQEEETETLKAQARDDAEQIIVEARRQAQELEAETRKVLADERKEVLDQGREEGRVEGYGEGRTEVQRLVERTQTVLERAQDKRGEILAETEQEIIDLVLLIARKVVKVISESQRSVVVSNVVQALRKVRDRGNIIIRVNLADLKLTTEHTKDFIQMLEGVKSIQVIEDSSVDPGGCIIETDFGEIEARIASQLAELETKILEISPIKSKLRGDSPAAAGLPANSAAMNGAAMNGAAAQARAAAATRAALAAKALNAVPTGNGMPQAPQPASVPKPQPAAGEAP